MKINKSTEICTWASSEAVLLKNTLLAANFALTSFGLAITAMFFAAGFVAEDSRAQLRVAFSGLLAVGIICIAVSSIVETSLMRKQCELMERIERGDEWLNNSE